MGPSAQHRFGRGAWRRSVSASLVWGPPGLQPLQGGAWPCPWRGGWADSGLFVGRAFTGVRSWVTLVCQLAPEAQKRPLRPQNRKLGHAPWPRQRVPAAAQCALGPASSALGHEHGGIPGQRLPGPGEGSPSQGHRVPRKYHAHLCDPVHVTAFGGLGDVESNCSW